MLGEPSLQLAQGKLQSRYTLRFSERLSIKYLPVESSVVTWKLSVFAAQRELRNPYSSMKTVEPPGISVAVVLNILTLRSCGSTLHLVAPRFAEEKQEKPAVVTPIC